MRTEVIPICTAQGSWPCSPPAGHFSATLMLKGRSVDAALSAGVTDPRLGLGTAIFWWNGRQHHSTMSPDLTLGKALLLLSGAS